ncbi:unnamed protein product [Sphenostylis stenocarpa]|uniref:Uncharacterized protein n=1 Tax=Sphenostylis stenocarpa TaxID=92480 RepID=A0AA86TH34_9FABA|nr:unnamed protein product [Sphenostylis stenocarpa]
MEWLSGSLREAVTSLDDEKAGSCSSTAGRIYIKRVGTIFHVQSKIQKQGTMKLSVLNINFETLLVLA